MKLVVLGQPKYGTFWAPRSEREQSEVRAPRAHKACLGSLSLRTPPPPRSPPDVVYGMVCGGMCGGTDGAAGDPTRGARRCDRGGNLIPILPYNRATKGPNMLMQL